MISGVCRIGVFLIAVMLCLVGCSRDGGSASTGAKPTWELVLTMDGAPVHIPLETLDVYLVEDHQYAESYEMKGDGVTLAGEFPLDVHVDYEEAWNRLIGKTVKISPIGGIYGETESVLTLPGGAAMKVVGGSWTADKHTGRYAGMEGDLTLSGTIILRVQGADGDKTYEGTFSAHCISWG